MEFGANELLIKTAQRCWEIGLNAIPARLDKRPVGDWQQFQRRMITEEEFLSRMNGGGLGIVCGKVSQQLEVIDIDQKYDLTGDLSNDYFKLIFETDQELFESLFIVRTISGGYHIYYRCEEIEGNQKFAARPATPEELLENQNQKSKTLIESRGEGGFIIGPPTPGYAPWQKNDIPTISTKQRRFLHDAARSFNELHEEIRAPKEQFTGESPFELTPWDDFDKRGDIIDLLINDGWKVCRQYGPRKYLTRPGKDKGTSADYNRDLRLFKAWSTSVSDFTPEKAYSHTAVYAILIHNGDFSKAAAELETQGYGKRIEKGIAFHDSFHNGHVETTPPLNGVGNRDTLEIEGAHGVSRNETPPLKRVYRNDTPFTGTQPATSSKPLVNYDQLFLTTVLDQKRDYPLPTPIISLKYQEDTYPLLTLKSFSLWQGKQKSKKTVTLALMISCFIRHTLSNEEIDFVGQGEGRVLWIDCEQGESYAARTMKLILKLAGLDQSDRIVYCDFRDHGPVDRMRLIEAGIRNTPGVALVVVDGIVDLMGDFMDAGEGHAVITRLLMLSSVHNVHIAGVLHQNKADKNARAHVGSIGSQKCELEVSTEVDGEDTARSKVTCVNSRGMPFKEFAIRWDKGALPCIDLEFAGTPRNKKEANDQKEYEVWVKVAKEVFKPLVALKHTDAQSAIMRLTKKKESTATRMIKALREWGIITQGEDKLYRIVV